MRPEPIHLLILLIVVIVIFGAAKLPSVAKNLGKSMKVFRDEVKDMRSDSTSAGGSDDQPREIVEKPATRLRDAEEPEADDIQK